MFTTIMYGVINEVTRQPASANIPLRKGRATPQAPGPGQRPRLRRVEPVVQGQGQLPGRYRVLADSFKRAAGFY
jgi:hypothetical protein